MNCRISKLLSSVSLVLATLAFAPASYATVQLQVTNGILMGATGVDVNGTLYDVQFENGSCDSLFNNCTTFMFSNLADANAASQSLLDNVFIDGPAGNFDSNPQDINGCSYTVNCWSLTPYALDPLYSTPYVYTSAAEDVASPGVDQLPGGGEFDGTMDMTQVENVNWAVWSLYSTAPPTSTVPEPASLSLLGIGLIGLGVNSRLKRKARVG